MKFILDCIATYRLTKLLIEDEITSDLRDKIFDRYPPQLSKIGFLFTCPWCMSIWAGAFVFGLRKTNPALADYVSSVLAASQITSATKELLEEY